MTGCPTPSPKPLRDNEAAERELVGYLETWQAKFQLTDWEASDIVRRQVHYLRLRQVAELIEPQ